MCLLYAYNCVRFSDNFILDRGAVAVSSLDGRGKEKGIKIRDLPALRRTKFLAFGSRMSREYRLILNVARS